MARKTANEIAALFIGSYLESGRAQWAPEMAHDKYAQRSGFWLTQKQTDWLQSAFDFAWHKCKGNNGTYEEVGSYTQENGTFVTWSAVLHTIATGGRGRKNAYLNFILKTVEDQKQEQESLARDTATREQVELIHEMMDSGADSETIKAKMIEMGW